MTKLPLVVASCCLLVAAGQVPDGTFTSPTRAQLDALVRAFRTEHRIPALSVAVGDGGSLVYARADGLADVEGNREATLDTAFRIASVTKPLTAVLVLRLAESGRLSLDAPIQDYCPQYPAKQWELTARDLLSHVGGVPDYQGVERGVWWFRTPTGDMEGSSTHHYRDLNEALTLINELPLAFKPGTRFSYTNGGFLLLGCAVETVMRTDFSTALTQEVLRIAGMDRTFADDAYAIIPNRGRQYQMRREQNKDYWWWTRTQKKQMEVDRLYNARFEDLSLKLPTGGWISTASDLIRFANALSSGALLRTETLQQMYTERMTADGKATGWGLGISVGNAGGERIVGLAGGQAGASAHLRMVPAKKFAVAVIANRDLAPVGELLNRIGALYGVFETPEKR